MSQMHLIFDLPVELSGEIVGRWLRVEEITRLDSAFCQTAARETLHRSVFVSSSCIVTAVGNVCGNDLFLLETLNWVASRGIRVEHVSVSGKNDMISVEYLQMFGKNIMSIKLSENCLQFSASSALIAHYCVYLRSVEYSAD